MSSQTPYPLYTSSSTSPPLPISYPSKPTTSGPPYNAHHAHQRLATSPPEASSLPTPPHSNGPSVAPSTYTNSDFSSGTEYDGSSSSSASGLGLGGGAGPHGAGAGSIDLVALMGERLQGAFDPLPLDRGLVTQAQTSGELNAKTRELRELQALAQRRLAGSRANFADGIKAAKEVKRDLEWTAKRTAQLKTKTERKYPGQYGVAQGRYPAPVDY
ncbi:MAG: hypothetical protein M1819_000468 [Sarea resinae]|nr:MAG: hypothetical protein M1819_000468 [Sarea resinae]